MGLIIILDKSAFHMLSHRESIFLDKHFEQNVTSYLVVEVMADLAKILPGQKDPQQYVRKLAQKFGGSGGVVNHDHYDLCMQSLLGARIPMMGSIIPDNWFQAPNGGVLIDLSPWNAAIMKWARGDFSASEEVAAAAWQRVKQAPSFNALWTNLIEKPKVIMPTVKSRDELRDAALHLADDAALQAVWLRNLFALFQLPVSVQGFILDRWEREEKPLLRTFAPYAHFCLRIWLSLLAAIRNRLTVEWKPTHITDIFYLHYLPFCMVFASDDKLHRALAPTLIRDDQSFITGKQLKGALKTEMDEWDALTDAEKARRAFALGGYPRPRRDSLLYQLFKKHMRPWERPMGNLITKLSENERREAYEEAVRWVAEAET